jgi:hypothetical protein
MAGRQRYSLVEVSAALKSCNGLLFLAAAKLGCTPQTMSLYLRRYARLRREVNERRGRRVDLGEAALDNAVLRGEAWAVQFLLRTQGKDRDYVERQELTGQDGGPLQHDLSLTARSNFLRLVAILRERVGLPERNGEGEGDQRS